MAVAQQASQKVGILQSLSICLPVLCSPRLNGFPLASRNDGVMQPRIPDSLGLEFPDIDRAIQHLRNIRTANGPPFEHLASG